MSEWQQWFKDHENVTMNESNVYYHLHIQPEELYQAFKARLMDEVKIFPISIADEMAAALEPLAKVSGLIRTRMNPENVGLWTQTDNRSEEEVRLTLADANRAADVLANYNNALENAN